MSSEQQQYPYTYEYKDGLTASVGEEEVYDAQTKHDDLRIIDRYIEYDQKHPKRVAYLTYILDKREDDGEWERYVKVVKFCKTYNVPKELREKKALMVSQDEMLSSVWKNDINFLCIYVNMPQEETKTDDPNNKIHGFYYLYGVQCVRHIRKHFYGTGGVPIYYDETASEAEKIAQTLKVLKDEADAKYGGLINLLRGNFRQAQFLPLEMNEALAIQDTIENAPILQVLRGIPKTHISAASGVTTSLEGVTTTPDGIEQNEEFIRGMLHDKYANIIMAIPIPHSEILRWSDNTAKELSKYKSQYSGMISHNAGVSIPVVFAGNLSATLGNTNGVTDTTGDTQGITQGISDSASYGKGTSEGTSHSVGYSNGQSMGIADSTSQANTSSQAQGLSQSQSLTNSIGTSQTESNGTTHGITNTESYGRSHTVGKSETFGESETQAVSNTHSLGRSATLGHTSGETIGQTMGVTQGHTIGNTNGTSTTVGHTQGSTWGQTVGQTTGDTFGQTTGHTVGDTTGHTVGTTRGQTTGQTFGTTAGNTYGVTNGTTQGITQGHTVGNTTGNSITDSDSFGTSNSYGGSHSLSNGTSSSVGISSNSGISQSAGHTIGSSATNSNSANFGTSENWNQGVSGSYSHSGSMSAGTSTNVGGGGSWNVGYNDAKNGGGSIGGLGTGFNASASAGGSHGAGENVSWGNSGSSSYSSSNSYGGGYSSSVGGGISKGWGNSQSLGITDSNSFTNGFSQSVGQSQSSGQSQSASNGNSWSNGTSQSNSHSVGHTNSQSVSNSISNSYSQSLSNSHSQSLSHSLNNSNSYSLSNSASDSLSHSSSNSLSNSHSRSLSNSFSDSFSRSLSDSLSRGISSSVSDAHSLSNSLSNSHSLSRSSSLSQGVSEGWSQGYSHGFGRTHSVGQTISDGVTQSVSRGISDSNSHTVSNGLTRSQSTGNSIGRTESLSHGTSTGIGKTANQGLSRSLSDSQGVTNGTSTSDSRSNGKTTSSSNSLSNSQGLSAAKSSALGSGTGMNFSLGPSFGVGRSYQIYDESKGNLIKLLEVSNTRWNLAVRMGAFHVDSYVVSYTAKAAQGVALTAVTSWGGDNELATIQCVTPGELTQAHLLKHVSVLDPCSMKDPTPNVPDNYVWSTIMLTSELAALTHLPRVETGGISTVATNIPPFSVFANKSGEIFFGKQINYEDGEPSFNYYFTKQEFMHTLICGASGSGKTTSAVRMAREVIRNYPDMKIFALDWKNSWRVLKRFAPDAEENFEFFGLDYSSVRPIRMNLFIPPKHVGLIQWCDKVIESICLGYGFGNKMYGVLKNASRISMLINGVLTLNENGDPIEVKPQNEEEQALLNQKVAHVTMKQVYEIVSAMKAGALKDGTALASSIAALSDANARDYIKSKFVKPGQSMNDTFDSILTKLESFYAGELKPLYCVDDYEKCLHIEDIIDGKRIVVLEGGDLDGSTKKAIIGLISWGLFLYSRLKKNRDKVVDKRFYILEEAHRIIDNPDSKSGGPVLDVGENIFEILLNEAREYGVYCMIIVQTPSHLPPALVTNCAILIIHRLGNDEDITLMTQMLARNARLDNRDVPLFLSKMPIGWACIRINNKVMHQESEPALVQVARCPNNPPSNEELILSLPDVEIPNYIIQKMNDDKYLAMCKEDLDDFIAGRENSIDQKYNTDCKHDTDAVV